jgi:hypothetical protein
MALSECLKSNSFLQKLYLYCESNQNLNEYILTEEGNRIGTKGAIALSECLKSNSSLQILDLGGKSNQNFK